MYLTCFGLDAAPFALTPHTAFAFPSRAQREGLDALAQAIEGGEGFIQITGAVGTGKTLLCQRFLARTAGACDPSAGSPAEARSPSEARSAKEGGANEGFRTAYVPNPCLSPRALLLAIAHELKIDAANVNSDSDLMQALDGALLQLAAQGLRALICLDEAQAMPIETLEALQFFSNLETGKRQRVQVVLFGRPELDRKLARPQLRPLRAQINFQRELGVLAEAETEAYLAHRLRIAGYRSSGLFPADVAHALHHRACGVPRLVNLIAHKSLLLAQGQGSPRVTLHQVHAAANDTPRVGSAGLLDLWPRWLRFGATW
jgi:MSHA biogenesis protein MshM